MRFPTLCWIAIKRSVDVLRSVCIRLFFKTKENQMEILLRAIGLTTIVLTIVAIWRIIRAIVLCCDNATASAKLSLSHYKGRVVWVTGASSGYPVLSLYYMLDYVLCMLYETLLWIF